MTVAQSVPSQCEQAWVLWMRLQGITVTASGKGK